MEHKVNHTPLNIQEYVITKILSHLTEKDEEICKLKLEIVKQNKQIKKMKMILKDNQICYNCICSRCNKKIAESDSLHSHNCYENYQTLCANCFFILL